MTTNEISNSVNTLYMRDIIARIEELREEMKTPRTADNAAEQDDMFAELADLNALMEELRGGGGEERWEGHWYPATLIRDSYFEDYARELAEDIGAVKDSAEWPHNCIDWEQAARELKLDYIYVRFDGVWYWCR